MIRESAPDRTAIDKLASDIFIVSMELREQNDPERQSALRTLLETLEKKARTDALKYGVSWQGDKVLEGNAYSIEVAVRTLEVGIRVQRAAQV